MNKDEMLEDIKSAIGVASFYKAPYQAQEMTDYLWRKGYRKVGEDEIVIKKEDADYITELYREKIGQVEKWRNLCELKIKETRQETARENADGFYCDVEQEI